MAVYKVPQDVEADDKLLGPFSFRQFIYLIVVAISGAGAWGLAQLFIPLAIIPLPFILFFGALALPLRKDQPMEAYLTAIVSFYFLKSRRRFWEPDGIDSFVTIIAPKNADIKRTKDIDETEAQKRFSYLAGIVDSHGWAVRGSDVEAPANLSNDLYYEAQSATDVMDNNTSMAQGLDRMLQDSDAAHKKQLTDQMATPAPAPVQPQPIATPMPVPAPAGDSLLNAAQSNPLLGAQPYQPTAQPKPVVPASDARISDSRERDAITLALGLAEEAEEERLRPTQTTPDKKPEETPVTTSVTPPSAGTIDLATNRPELTIQTISEEAHRLQEKEEKKADDEVFISLH
jgi:hypothetical protein